MARTGRGRRRGSGEKAPTCPICGNPVRDAKTAILHRATGDPAHFDCILRELAHGESLEKGEKITYLGKGTFGVLSYRNASSQVPYLIRKRMHYEDQEQRAAWRIGQPQ